MPENTSYTPRQWHRQASSIPISLILEDAAFKADDSAITLDISPRGKCSDQAGARSRRVSESRRQCEDLASRCCTRGLVAGG